MLVSLSSCLLALDPLRSDDVFVYVCEELQHGVGKTETDFGQSDFGQTDFGLPQLSDFGQNFLSAFRVLKTGRYFSHCISRHQFLFPRMTTSLVVFLSGVVAPVTAGRDRLWPIQFWPIHFWPSWFWPGQFWPNPIWANPILPNPIFGSGV